MAKILEIAHEHGYPFMYEPVHFVRGKSRAGKMKV